MSYGARDETGQLTHDNPDAMIKLDVAAHRRDVNALLTRASELVRAGSRGRKIARRGADLIGADLRAPTCEAPTYGARTWSGLISTGADLYLADVTGADLRGADLSSAGLYASIFLTQPQLDAANGDAATKVPPGLARPAHWSLSGAR